MSEVERVAAAVAEQYETVDALALFANRVSPKRQETPDGMEFTFALYYLSRYLLGRRLRPLLDAAPDPVIVNIAGVGTTAGRIFWDDPQLTRRYGQVRAQLQAGRANDLLGAFFARPVADAVRPVVEWIDRPPSEPLSAVDRGKPVPKSLKTLDPGDAARLATYTESLLHGR